MDRGQARHLLRRTGGDTRPTELDAVAVLSRGDAVDRILDFGPNPAWSPPRPADDKRGAHANAIAAYWVDRWATIPRPFEMKLLLFFHSHFAVHVRRMSEPRWMDEYLTTIHPRMLGDFGELVKAVALSPAMLSYLDNNRNRVGRTNENFARECFELHLLGANTYTQSDVAEAARAWTGHTIGDDGSYRYRADWHDDGDKTVLGVRRNWDGPELIDHVLADPALRVTAARHIVGRLWHFLTATDAPGAVLDAVAQVFVANSFQVRPMLRALLLREEFLTGIGSRPIPRTPMEYVADLQRVTGLRSGDVRPHQRLRQMGQMPFQPPSPAGWDDVSTFISASAFMTRAAYARLVAVRAQNGTTFLEGIPEQPPGDAALTALRAFGLDDVSAANRQLLQDYVAAQRGQRGWQERLNVTSTVALSPDAQVG
ncbi:MAG: DUF1800 family protein [Actinomycetota bacterium]